MLIMVGVGRAAQEGVLIRNAEALERMARVDTLVIDKTGTLTEGKPSLTGMHTVQGLTEGELLTFAASIERASEHPLGAAVVTAALERGLQLADVEEFVSSAGGGVSGYVQGKRILVGSADYLGRAGVPVDALHEAAETARLAGATAVFVASDGSLAGFLSISDRIKQTAPAAITALRKSGLRIVMLTEMRAARLSPSPTGWLSMRWRLKYCRRTRPRLSAACVNRAASSRWLAMASTTPLPSRWRMSASRWVPVRILLSKARM